MIDRDQLRKDVDEVQSRTGKIRFIKKNSTTLLRVVEFTDAEGKQRFHRLVTTHNKPGGGKPMGMCNAETFGTACAFCKVDEQAAEQGGEVATQKRRKYYVNGVDVNDRKPQMRRWALPGTVWEAIANAAMSDDWSDVLEVETGHAFSVTSKGTGLDTEYEATPARKPWPVSDDLMEGVIDPLDELHPMSLEAQCEILGCDVSDLFTEDELTPADEPEAVDETEAGDEDEPEAEPEEEPEAEPEEEPEDITPDEPEEPEEEPEAEGGDDQPRCHGDADLYAAEDVECKTCGHRKTCVAKINAAKAGQNGKKKPITPADAKKIGLDGHREHVQNRKAEKTTAKAEAAKPAATKPAAGKPTATKPAATKPAAGKRGDVSAAVAGILGKKKGK